MSLLQSIKDGHEKHFPGEDLMFGKWSVDEWIEDIKHKHINSQRKNEEARLKRLEGELHDLLSIDTKVDMRIKDLESEI